MIMRTEKQTCDLRFSVHFPLRTATVITYCQLRKVYNIHLRDATTYFAMFQMWILRFMETSAPCLDQSSVDELRTQELKWFTDTIINQKYQLF